MGKRATTPLYQMISDNLIAKIQMKEFRYDVPICTEKSICEEYHVSRITAKKAIENLEHMGILYRKRGVGSFVAQTDKKGGYQLPELSVKENIPHKTMALMIPFSISQGGIFKAIETATNILARSGHSLTLNVYEPGFQNEKTMLESLRKSNIDGLVYYPSTGNLPTEILDQFCDNQKPVVILDKPHEYRQYSSVVCDNFKGGSLLTEHLVSYGHRNICYLSRVAQEDVWSIRDRYAGLAGFLRDSGMNFTPDLIKIDVQPNESFDYPMLKHIINKLYREGVTAVECENDEVAFYVHMCCRSLSIRMPEDISVTGFDNITWATMGSAQITTVEQDFELIGKNIADLLLLRPYKPEHRVIPVRLVPRNSTGPARSL